VKIRKGDRIRTGKNEVVVVDLYPSFNRDAFLGENGDGERWVYKGFSRDRFGKELTKEDISFIITNVTAYRLALAQCGVSVIKNVGFSFQTLDDDVLTLWQDEPFAGLLCEIRIRDSRPAVALETVEKIWDDIVKPLFVGARIDNSIRLNVGIDLIPRNITYNADSDNVLEKVTYVDIFPPKLLIPNNHSEKKHRHILEFPDPTDEIVRKLAIIRGFNMAGIIMSFWGHLTRIRPSLGLKFNELLSQKVTQLDKELGLNVKKAIKRYANGLNPLIGSMPKSEIFGLIKDWGGFEDVFNLRFVTCALIQFREYDNVARLTNEIFEVSHFQDYPLSKEDIQEMKKMILEIASKPLNVNCIN